MCGEEEYPNPTVQQIGDFNHITNLDVYVWSKSRLGELM